MAHLFLPITDVAAKVAAAGFTGWQVVTGTAIVGAESAFDAYAVNVVGEQLRADGTPNPAYRSLDLGLFQVNTYWNPDATIAALLDPEGNVRAARRIFERRFHGEYGTYSEKLKYAWSAWVTYQKGLHKPFEAEAFAAAKAIGVAV